MIISVKTNFLIKSTKIVQTIGWRLYSPRMRKFYSQPVASLLVVIVSGLLLQFGSPIQNSSAQEHRIPNLWDPNERLTKPDNSKIGPLKFITTTNFPPFSFVSEGKQIAGFNVDLARAICRELNKINTCQIQALPWEEHAAALKEGRGTALITGLAINAITRQQFIFTQPYLNIPARFVGQRQTAFLEPLHRSLDSRTIGVVDGTAHAEYLKDNFGKVQIRIFTDQQSAFASLAKKDIDAVFSDALTISFWLHSNRSNGCCEFIGGPYLSYEYFGHGHAIAVQRDNKPLRNALNFALRSISDKHIFSELYLKYFPENLY